MNIHISEHDGVPIYLQIVNQVKLLIASGRLSPSEELPAIRNLAEQLRVNPNTVARAYRELENAGIVEKKRTAGTYVSETGPRLSKEECLRILTERIDALIAEAKQMDFTTDEVLNLIRKREAWMSGEEVNQWTSR
jgi:GntR family transcriptional regulator